MEASETFIKGPKVLWLSKAVSVRQCGAAIKWEKGNRQAPHLIFLLGAQVDKLATLFTAFFPSPLCTVRTANRIHAAATVVSY